jgi:hypothetical protein
MALTITAVSPTTIKEDGGYELEITGTFTLNNRHRVHIGNTKSTTDLPGHSGKAGQGSIVYPKTTTTIKVFSPPLSPVSDPYSVYIVDIDGGENDLLEDVINVEYLQYASSVFNIRSVLPPFYKTGPRSIEQVGDL